MGEARRRLSAVMGDGQWRAFASCALLCWALWGWWLAAHLTMLEPAYTPSEVSQISESWYQNHGLRVVLLYFTSGLSLIWLLLCTWTWHAERARGGRAIARALAVAMVVLAGAECIAKTYDEISFRGFCRDPLLGWVLAKDRPDQNSVGFRGAELSAAPVPGEIRVLCVGDSCTYGWGVAANATWPARLQHHLERLLPANKVTVINAGVPAYNSAQGLLALARALWLKPTLVIFAFDHNDRTLWVTAAEDLLERSHGVSRITRASHLLSFFRTEILHWRGGDASPLEFPSAQTKHVGLAFYQQVLSTALRMCSDAGATLIVLVLPDNHLGVPGDSSEGSNMLRVQVSRSLDIPFINLIPHYRGRADLASHFQGDAYHLTAEGCDSAGELVAKALLRKKLVP